MTHNFLESLKFFDRDTIPIDKVHKLEEMVNQTMRFEGVRCVSGAAVPIGMWLSALVDYHKVMMAVEPLRTKLRVAEETLINVNNSCLCACDSCHVHVVMSHMCMYRPG